MQLEIEREALKKEKDEGSKERLEGLGKGAGQPAREQRSTADRSLGN